jgi:hypothetical protein
VTRCILKGGGVSRRARSRGGARLSAQAGGGRRGGGGASDPVQQERQPRAGSPMQPLKQGREERD